ncbi:hypothetical protein FQR65_LT07090 [Abscondita terminalis]|nr:hypothetical protein FQR65_LT07090 [Abscondita terminalis]
MKRRSEKEIETDEEESESDGDVEDILLVDNSSNGEENKEPEAVVVLKEKDLFLSIVLVACSEFLNRIQFPPQNIALAKYENKSQLKITCYSKEEII